MFILVLHQLLNLLDFPSVPALTDEGGSEGHQLLPIRGVSHYPLLSLEALLPFDGGAVFDGLLLKHFFTQLDTTRWKG